MLGLSQSVNVRVRQECRICYQEISADKIDRDVVDVKLFGCVAYAQCPACRQTVSDHRDPNYRARVRRFMLRRGRK